LSVAPPQNSTVLEVQGLQTHLFTRAGVVKAVDGVSFALRQGETLAIVGESGCGKSMTALSIMRLVPSPPGRIVTGSVSLAGRDLLRLTAAEMREVRGNEVSMIFQEPMTSLNPVLTIGSQIGEAFRLHEDLSHRAAREAAIEMLRRVRIPDPARRAREYPHQLSGGMRQRAMIAMALACNPRVLIADEPTTALDVTIQAQILDLILALQRELGIAIILITHNLGMVAEVAERVIVMYAGRKVEEADVDALFAAAARHPGWTSPRGRDSARDSRHCAAAQQSAARLRFRAALRLCRCAVLRDIPTLRRAAARSSRGLLARGTAVWLRNRSSR
jgi:peptide/nickel transport system ATP-binding protein